MTDFADLQADALSVDGFANQNGLIPTRYGGNKKSWQYLVDEFSAEFAQTLLEINKSRGYRVVGTFAAGFDYELFNDVGIDASGNSWIYVGTGAPVATVAPGTDPSLSADYKQVTFNSIDGVSGLRDELNNRALELTLAEAQVSDLQVGQYVRFVDRALGLYRVDTGLTNNGIDIVDLGNGLSAKYIVTNIIVAEELGAEVGADNTLVYQRMAIIAQDGCTFVCLAGENIASGNTTITTPNTTVIGGATFKTASGSITPYGVLSFAAPYCHLESVTFDGNETNVVDEDSFGASAQVVIGSSAKGFSGKSVAFKNTAYSAISYNGNAGDTSWESLDFENIGEHPIYYSGGGNGVLTIDGIRVKNFGNYYEKGKRPSEPVHECFIVKSRDIGNGNNEKVIIKNITVEFDEVCSNANAVMQAIDLDLGHIVQATMETGTSTKIPLFNCTNNHDFEGTAEKVYGFSGVYAGGSANRLNITVTDARFDSFFDSRMLSVRKYENAVFNMGTSSITLQATTALDEKCIMDTCVFNTDGAFFRMDSINHTVQLTMKDSKVDMSGCTSTTDFIIMGVSGGKYKFSDLDVVTGVNGRWFIRQTDAGATSNTEFILEDSATDYSGERIINTISERLKIRNMNKYRTYGTTAQRPTVAGALRPGQFGIEYYDTTINKKIMWNETNNQWEDFSGNSV